MYFEEGGVRMAVLACGDLILLKKQGDEVGSDFRLVVVDPPALLHLPTGMVLQVRRQVEGPIIGRTPQSVAPIETTNPSEFEAALARALVSP